jgi:hypothetical protein
MLSMPDFEARLAATFSPCEFNLIDSDEFVPNNLIATLIERPRDSGDSYFWVVLFERYDNGWFEVLSDHELGVIYTQPANSTIAIVSGRAPDSATACRVRLFGEARTRETVNGLFIAGFFSAHLASTEISDLALTYL